MMYGWKGQRIRIYDIASVSLVNIRYYKPVEMAIPIVSFLKNIEPTAISKEKRQESICLVNIGVERLSITSQSMIVW